MIQTVKPEELRTAVDVEIAARKRHNQARTDLQAAIKAKKRAVQAHAAALRRQQKLSDEVSRNISRNGIDLLESANQDARSALLTLGDCEDRYQQAQTSKKARLEELQRASATVEELRRAQAVGEELIDDIVLTVSSLFEKMPHFGLKETGEPNQYRCPQCNGVFTLLCDGFSRDKQQSWMPEMKLHGSHIGLCDVAKLKMLARHVPFMHQTA
jgi:hypothetical protein